MAAPKRSRPQRESDLATIAHLYRDKHLTQDEIGEELGLSQQVISRDIATIIARWQADANQSISEHVALELARINRIETLATDAWLRSCEEAEKTVTSKTTRGGETTSQARIEKANTNGDPRFLAIMLDCVEKRMNLLGTAAPKRHEVTGKGGRAVQIQTIVAHVPVSEG